MIIASSSGGVAAIRKIVDRGFLWLEQALALALVIAVALNVGNVVCRYVFGFTISFSDEIELFILVFVTFLGAAIVSWRRAHLRMDMLILALPDKARRVVSAIEVMLVFGLMSYFAFQSWDYSVKMFLLDRRSDIANLPMWVPNGSLAIGFGLIALVSLFHLATGIARFAEGETAPSLSAGQL